MSTAHLHPGQPKPMQTAALGTLIILQLTMLGALFFKVPPHPPEIIPIGGMAPMVGAALCAAFAALVFKGEGTVGKLMIILTCLLSAISYGPQKFFDPAFPLVWPAVIAGQIAVLALLIPIGRSLLRRSE